MRPLLVFPAILLMTSLAMVGCKSPEGPGSDSLAAVEISGRSFVEVARTTSEVFQEAGFQPAPLPPNQDREKRLVFEKRGTAGDGWLYGDWSSSEIWYRAKVVFATHGADTYLIKCDAFRVLEKGSKHFEEEHKLSRAKRGAYQDLLNKVKAKLQGAKA